MKRVFVLAYSLVGVYLLANALYLLLLQTDGSGFGIYPFGIELELANRYSSPFGLLLLVVSVLFLLYPICNFLFTFRKTTKR